MRFHLLAAAATFLCLACGSGNDQNKAAETLQSDAGDEATTNDQPDAGLPACPEEVKLSGSEFIPCDCYGQQANEAALADPNIPDIYPGSQACLTQVVCCPTIQGLRCEDHEYVDDAGNIIDGSTAADAGDDAPIPTCTYETDLSAQALPCDCKGTIVPDPPSDLLPDCAKTIVCCPSQGVICE